MGRRTIGGTGRPGKPSSSLTGISSVRSGTRLKPTSSYNRHARSLMSWTRSDINSGPYLCASATSSSRSVSALPAPEPWNSASTHRLKRLRVAGEVPYHEYSASP